MTNAELQALMIRCEDAVRQGDMDAIVAIVHGEVPRLIHALQVDREEANWRQDRPGNLSGFSGRSPVTPTSKSRKERLSGATAR
jgi:hypothetical protein